MLRFQKSAGVIDQFQHQRRKFENAVGRLGIFATTMLDRVRDE
jgi:hypothetical protein